MPEIAECYTIARKIKPAEVKETKTSARFFKYIFKSSKKVFDFFNKPFRLHQPIAFGKSVWLPLENSKNKAWLVSQLGMSGSWFLDNLGREEKNDHLTFLTTTGKLRYSDPRMFGKMRLFIFNKETSFEEGMNSALKNFKWGIDPIQSSRKELVNSLKKWQKSSKNIKALMLEQNVVFGIGNYLASEVLFGAKISPLRTGKSLSELDIENLAEAIKSVLKISIKTGGYSFAGGYYHPDGSVGVMAPYIKVYDKAEEKCQVCGTKISKISILGRSTFYCSRCQK